METCPKCGYERKVVALECPRCLIVYEKYKPRKGLAESNKGIQRIKTAEANKKTSQNACNGSKKEVVKEKGGFADSWIEILPLVFFIALIEFLGGFWTFCIIATLVIIPILYLLYDFLSNNNMSDIKRKSGNVVRQILRGLFSAPSRLRKWVFEEEMGKDKAYGVLGLKEGATKEQIIRAYCDKVEQCHPEFFGEEDIKQVARKELKEVIKAHKTLLKYELG